MSDYEMYHHGSRQLQDQFDSLRIADRLEQVTVHTNISEDDRRFIKECGMFFLATADDQGRPDCSYKGGMPGFVRILDEHTLAFPGYDGNGMFRSFGNILVNPQVGLLFIDFEHPKRIRLNGIASLHLKHALLSEYQGAQLLIEVAVQQIFPNCPRYIHKLSLIEHSIYTPKTDHTPPEPEWKRMKEFRDALPRSSGKNV
jgi:predicted pyridoxine 5'-phosphate oxidase superfamily flavin-nucleotide-binding protein